MHWEPDGDQSSRVERARLLRSIRDFFYQRQVLEVETPALSSAANSDPYIESFELISNCTGPAEKRYLHTSPEYPMKRLLAAGSGDIYQICKVWRAEPTSRQHNAEFTMLEYYRVGYDLKKLMSEVDDLLHSVVPELIETSLYTSYASLFLDNLSFNPHTIEERELWSQVNAKVPGFTGELDRQSALDLLLTHCIENQFPEDRLTFVYDYPATQSALAKTTVSADNPEVTIAKRFEVYVGSIELGNGYEELIDATKNESVLKNELDTRNTMNLPSVSIDNRFLAATRAGLPECAGIAIGIDRVLMLLTGAIELKQVINFSWENA